MDGCLWPDGTVSGRSGRGTTPYLCLPSRTDTRLLVPLHHRRAAAHAVRRRLSGTSVPAAARRAAAWVGTRSGAAQRWRSRQLHVAGDGELTAVVSAAMGVEVVIALHLGARRANRKPVLEVMDVSGRVLAWGKLGVNDLTDRLVRGEAYALARLGSLALRHLEVPRLRANLQWRGRPLVLMTALHPTREPVGVDLLARSAYELAQAFAAEDPDQALARYRDTLAREVTALPATPLAARMAELLPELTSRLEGCRFGAWHGDWTPWNMGVDGGRLCVWDWERLATPVPQGMDLLHHRFQREVMSGTHTPGSAALGLLDWSAPPPPGGTGPDAEQRRALAILYLLAIGARYLADDQAATGNRLGAVPSWLEPVLQTWTSPRSSTPTPGKRA